MREFEPGVLPAMPDVGDKFDFEGKSYQAKTVTSGGWVWRLSARLRGLSPKSLVTARRVRLWQNL